ncbi:hypothetical protein FGG08_001959 [Glutinoglossum americanum]|uniref:Tim44-like domain-containing protein n=1 Tax=Glutinoglossum americanum TaxID=1670608 RepID=A0A9P8IG18_9PEZI|nr:hypothetical protein FGG08_001959 [Glutinoglossum americanum]
MSKKPRPILRLRQTVPTALALHRRMYTATAEGDLDTLRKITASGLQETLKSRILTRPPGERLVWSLHKYTKSPRVVSNRAGTLPIDGSGIRQAVVRIQSTQSLTRYAADGKMVPGTGNEREVKEYVVIQKLLWEGKEGPWILWGTTEETTRHIVTSSWSEKLNGRRHHILALESKATLIV